VSIALLLPDAAAPAATCAHPTAKLVFPCSFSPIARSALRRTFERARGGSIEAVGASRFDVCFGQANVAQMDGGQATKPALNVAARAQLMDEGQEAFERTIKKSARHAPCDLAWCRLRHIMHGHRNLRWLGLLE
jgi:hypothetical protein